MSRGRTRLLISRAIAFAAIVHGVTVAAAGLVDPRLIFHTITTPHFVINFHQGEARAAARLAIIAEETRAALQRPLAVTSASRTQVVLVDQTELANGFATPVPYDTIVITATWPAGSEFIGLTADWLRLVFTHEYTHVLHLDRSGGWARAVHAVFGRVPLAFPNVFLPQWQIEGLAVYEESQLPGQGRLHAGGFRAIVDAARRTQALEPLDRANGGLVGWPGGLAEYAYGGAFTRFLADRYGAASLADLANRTARMVPYTSSRAFKSVFGQSLGDLWRAFESAPAEPAQVPTADAAATRITHHGFTVAAPRFAPPSCGLCAPEIVYALQTPHAFPSLNAVRADGTNDRVLTTRYLGSATGVSRRFLVFDQQEIRRNVGLYSDLYVLDRGTRRVRALTTGTRLRDPDLSPDGTRVVCVREGDGRRDLMVATVHTTEDGIELGAPVALISEADTWFDAPRWSPNGLMIAVSRHVLGREPALVVVDADTGALRVIASEARTRFVTPAWKPDGQAIVAAADFDERAFNLYEFGLERGAPIVQLTHSVNDVMWPDLSPDGKTIVYVGYTTDGYDLFTVPYPSGSEADPSVSRAMSVAADAGQRPTSTDAAATPAPGVTPTPYTPWPTLKPTSWLPYFDSRSDQLRFGAAIQGHDVVSYHEYQLSATWLVSAIDRAPAVDRSVPDWQAIYTYARWRPLVFVQASRTTSFFSGPPTDAGTPTSATDRVYQAEAGVSLPFVHTRMSHALFASVLRSTDRYAFAQGPLDVRRTAVRGGWQVNTAHLFGYSISPERGVTAGATVETVPYALGSSASATSATVDARAYVPAFAQHDVFAVRAAAGGSWGSTLVGRTFLLGGARAAAAPLDFSRDALGLLRGFPADTFAGSRIIVANAEYRVPLIYVERGSGTLPLFLESVHAAIFGDAANAWTRVFRASDAKTSAGIELAANVVAGYSLPLTATVGAAWGHDGARLVRDGATVYLRLAGAF